MLALSWNGVRKIVAENPSTPAEVLAKLADDKDERWKVDGQKYRDVCQYVAGNPSTPPSTLMMLLEDGTLDVNCYPLRGTGLVYAINPSPELPIRRMWETQEGGTSVSWRLADFPKPSHSYTAKLYVYRQTTEGVGGHKDSGTGKPC